MSARISDRAIEACVERIADALVARGAMLATAESCTGGMIAAALTSIAGSSRWFERGFVTYSDGAKTEMLGVAAHTIERHGAVSEATACEMARGAIAHSAADVALAVTGIAGPGGGSEAKPVGTVCIAWCRRGEAPVATTFHFPGDRESVRRASVVAALQGLLEPPR
ncbi:MAG TPA: CinA family protein [Casimicrobiaceae bacterium]|nr:CinA family protein [Casimicrobiaceae bacterium]